MYRCQFIYCLTIAFATISASEAQDLRLVALTGQGAPGTPAGTNFLNFDLPVLNDDGFTAFKGRLRANAGGVTGNNNEGIWSEGTGTFSLVARKGSQAPGTASGTLFGTGFGRPILNDAGETIFQGNLLVDSGDATADSDEGIWSESAGTLGLVAREGAQAPGTPNGAVFDTLQFENSPVMNNSGQTAFLGALRVSAGGVSASNDSGIWLEGTGTPELVAREGSQAPGTESGINFGQFPISPVLSSAGQVAFVGQLQGTGVTGTNDSGIWSHKNGTLSPVAREGNQAPGTSSGVKFGQFEDAPVINGSGQTAFRATLDLSSGVTDFDNEGIWSEGSGVLDLVARENDDAPGTPSDALFRKFASPILNQEGMTSFVAFLRPGSGGVNANNKSGIWSDASGQLELIAREGSQAPGTPAGANFGVFSFSASVLNNQGRIAFVSLLQLDSGGVTSENGRGIWAQDSNGDLQLIVREGDSLEVMPGDSRTISRVDFVGETGNEDGRGSGFNDLGQIAFRATFTDNSYGVFVSNKVAFDAADFNEDGAVDAADLMVWESAYGTNGNADADGDGDSDGNDFLTWQREYDTAASIGPAVAAIPEPGTLAIVLAFCCGFARQRRFSR